MKIDGKFIVLGVFVCLASSVVPAHADGMFKPWKVKGWTQWHPQKGNHVLAAVGTQQYFAKPDPAPPAQPKPPMVKAEPAKPVVKEPVKVAKVEKPAPAPMVEKPNPDKDGDGVLNEQDLCPETPEGVKVNKQGCWILGKIFFHFDKATIQSQFTDELDEMVDYLVKNPQYKVELGGHTDNWGKDVYNQDLSKKRADAVMGYFRDKGVASLRMKSIGYGQSRPDTDNSTIKKRYFNRRVEVHPYK